MAGERTGKSLASRIPLDYHRRPNSVESWKRWLALLAFVGALAWVAVGFRFDKGRPALGDWGRLQASRGPVAKVHAAWDSDCEACHVPFTPIRSGGWTSGIFGHDASVSNAKCQQCHQGATHHETASPELDCASCHRDHRGRDASLVKLDDSACTTCHANLQDHRLASKAPKKPEPVVDSITAFVDGGHPEFRYVVKAKTDGDPGRLKFNHALHMTLGIPSNSNSTATGSSKSVPHTIGWIPDQTAASRYTKPGQAAESPLTLDCADCHVTDAGDFKLKIEELVIGKETDDPSGRLFSRSSGAYMMPITYENQCRACHPTAVDPSELQATGLSKELALTVPHGLQPDQLHGIVTQAAAARAIADGDEPSQLAPKDRRAMPGRSGEQAQRTHDLPETIRQTTADLERILFANHQTCYECHHYESEPTPELECRKPDGPLPPVVFGDGEPPALKVDGVLRPLRVVTPRVPQVWLDRGRFDHSAHTAVSCRSCHEAAFPDAPNASCMSRDVLIPNVKSCQTCHAPASRSPDGGRIGGVDHSCTECHGYHNGDAPHQGRGSSALGAEQARSFAEFLNARPTTTGGTPEDRSTP